MNFLFGKWIVYAKQAGIDGIVADPAVAEIALGYYTLEGRLVRKYLYLYKTRLCRAVWER